MRPAGKQPRIHPDVDFQAGLLAAKVTRRVMSLDAASQELADWQDTAIADAGRKSWDPVEPRALIVTHMMNSLLKRGY